MGTTIKELNNEFSSTLGDKYELKILKMSAILGTLGGVREVTDGDKDRRPSGLQLYVLYVDEKGSGSHSEIEVKLDDKASSKLQAAVEKIEKADSKKE